MAGMREAFGDRFIIEPQRMLAVLGSCQQHARLLEAFPDRSDPIRESARLHPEDRTRPFVAEVITHRLQL